VSAPRSTASALFSSFVLAALAFTLLPGRPAKAAPEPGSEGETIYRAGILPSGQPLRAEREQGLGIEGAAAACVNCHHRSGLGGREGGGTIPPIAGIYLFHPRAREGDDLDLPFVDGMRADRDPYTEATLARAIRRGIAADGRPMSYLMPHYTLGDSEMAALITHLKQLAPRTVPGVTASVLHFATIVTPDADPVKRDGMLDVLQKFFEDKNHYTRGDAPRLRSSRRMMFKVARKWQLHVWRLTGASETWERQLRAHLAAEPVFAVVSGIGGKTWVPVHRFCEAVALPCLFPNVDLPVVSENDFDSLYLSKGVLLDAELIADALKASDGRHEVRRIVQVFRADDVGIEAAQALSADLHDNGMVFVNRRLASGGGTRELTEALQDVRAGDALILWLRPADLTALGPPPASVSTVFISGRMGGLERAPIPASWRPVAHLADPVDLPDQRRVRLDYAFGWFRIRQIPVVAEQVQADTYTVCGIVSDTVNHMVDAFVRDYLVERIEEMLEHRIMTGHYPRLALAPHQRFASKGGYIVRFADATGTRVVPDDSWIVP
jgi:hypothetical protein